MAVPQYLAEVRDIDWASLRQRLSQNSTQEKLTKQWIDRCLKQLGMRPQLAAK